MHEQNLTPKQKQLLDLLSPNVLLPRVLEQAKTFGFDLVVLVEWMVGGNKGSAAYTKILSERAPEIMDSLSMDAAMDINKIRETIDDAFLSDLFVFTQESIAQG